MKVFPLPFSALAESRRAFLSEWLKSGHLVLVEVPRRHVQCGKDN